MLRLYRESLTPAMRATRQAADAVRVIGSQQGDLTFVMLENAFRLMADADRAAQQAVADLMAVQGDADEATAADAYVAEFGGPRSFAAFGQALGAVKAAAGAWYTRVGVALDAAQAAGTRGVMLDAVPVGPNLMLRRLRMAAALPAAYADPMRTSDETAALIAAFEAAGA